MEDFKIIRSQRSKKKNLIVYSKLHYLCMGEYSLKIHYIHTNFYIIWYRESFCHRCVINRRTNGVHTFAKESKKFIIIKLSK